MTSPAVGTRHERNLTVLLADEDEAALQTLGDVLKGLGHEVTPFAVSVEEAAELIVREDPDLTIVVVHQNDEHALALIGEAVETASGPVIAQLNGREDVDFVARAAERGISAYVESDDPQHVQAAIEVPIRRYREAARLNEKVGQLETALERRAVIERAKGIVMERHGIDEREAFELLRDHARVGQPPRGRRRAVRDGGPRAAARPPGQGLNGPRAGDSSPRMPRDSGTLATAARDGPPGPRHRARRLQARVQALPEGPGHRPRGRRSPTTRCSRCSRRCCSASRCWASSASRR